ncbi:exodeoxyribonuclease V subunit gamma, partial [Enterococcus cecorum]|nr:exodeoxyribonuclease V subunit gamma [Enterococcus cecorum]
ILAELSSETSTKLTVNEKQQLKAEFGHTLFIVTGFSDFSSEEFELLQHFMGYGQLCIDLLIDNPKKALSPLDIFYPTSQTYQRLIEMAKENQCKILLDEKVKEPANEWQQTIHQIWMNANQNAQFDISQAQTFSIARVENPQEELRRVAVKIKQLIQQEQGNLRLRDIQIFAPDLSIYQPFLQYTFDEAGIPFFVDTPQLMNQHPLTDLLKSLFAFHKYHFRFTDVLHFFKTELFILDDLLEQEDLQLGHLQMRRMIDELENVVLAYHYQGNDWVKEEDWVLPHYNFEDEKDI